MELELERNTFIEAMKRNGCPMWMFETNEDGNFEDMTMAHSWYAWRERAKAQVVPDSYCLVPKVIPDNVVSCLENSGYHWGEMTRDHYAPIYSLMVEVASESGAKE